MPPKKKGRSSNKKKNKGQSRPARATSKAKAASRVETIGRNVPTFHNNHVETTNDVVSPYERYKQCTSAFRDWLQSVLPPQFPLEKVVDLQKASDEIYQKSIGYYESHRKRELPIVIPREVMHNLDECLDLREKVSTAYGEADEGHHFMIATLKYCRRMLGFSRNVVRVAVNDSPLAGTTAVGGRFSALLEVEEDEQEEAQSDMEAIRSQEKLLADIEAPPKPKHEYTIEDIINGDDRFEACSFITTMNELMFLVEEHYSFMKQLMRGEASHEHDTSSFVKLMLECSVVANMTMEAVSSMEASLAGDHPHLSSFYAVLALVFLYPIIAEIEEAIGPDVRRQHPTLAKRFAGDIVECSFRNKGDPVKLDSVVKRFAKDSSIQETVAEKFAKEIKFATDTEITLACSERDNAEILALARSYGVRPHMWFARFGSLGSGRSILNTQNLVQAVMDIVQENTKLVSRPGFFGDSWDETIRPASRIQGDMDQVFAGEILPELIEVCKRQPISCLPNRQELMPLLDILATHLRNRKAPVPVSLTFGLQTILISLFLLQGHGDVNRLAASAQQSYNRLFQQLEEDSTADRPQPPTFYHNLKMFLPIRHLPSVIGQTGSDTAEKYTFWNPVVGGQFLLYATYITSIGLGSATVDTLGQLRFTMHLYNALKEYKLVQDIEFLETLDKVFANTKAVWVGGRPGRGSLAKHFWLAWGCSIEEASKRASSADGKKSLADQRKNLTRKLDEIRPEDFSASYRRLVLRDFSLDVDDYSVINTTDEQRKANKTFYGVISRINMTRDSMDDDEYAVIPTDITRVGCILIDFIGGLSKAMGWDDVIDSIVATTPDYVRHGNRTDGRRNVRRGGFEASDINLKWQALAFHIGNMLGEVDSGDTGQAALGAAFTKDYFDGVPKDSFTFIKDASESAVTGAPPSPLMGAYPPGRTGRTERDPLAAFFHCKYSKRGEPVARLIKPGPRTPYIMNATRKEQRQKGFDRALHIETPYQETGSKLPRQRNGRYRHIASYSLDELNALGWDGAKYNASGNHAAKGFWCPFVCGYDSDPDDQYDSIDVEAGKRAGTVGLHEDEVGLYMEVPSKGIVELMPNH